jgi:cytochrome b6-f complex iron-sulfur subunit
MRTMSERKLPVLPESASDEACGGGCDRRLILQGLAVAGLVSACRIDDPGASGDDDVPADAPPTGDAPAGTGFETCNTNQICVDLAHPLNANIANPDQPGFRVIVQGNTRIIIIRTDADTFITLSARCTHAGTNVAYRTAQNDIRCPNHGSLFNLDGSVKGGPATQPLREFASDFDAVMNLLTITLV